MILSKIGDRRDSSLILLRLAVGVIFIAHGWMKYQNGMDSVSGFFDVIGIPAPLFMAYLVTATELLGGAALIIGIFSRYAALLLAITMAVSIWTVKWSVGLIAATGAVPAVGYELNLILLVAALAVVLQGAGKYSLEYQLFQREII